MASLERRSIANSGIVARVGPGTAAPPSTVNTTTRLARLRRGIAKAMVRACSVLQFHAIKAFVPICDRGDGGATKTGRPLPNKAVSSVAIREPFGL
jgi:hypothetical protein